jgi:hypothetical protein
VFYGQTLTLTTRGGSGTGAVTYRIDTAHSTGEATIADVGTEIFNLILDVASGTKEPYSDQYGFHNDMCIFNPAPIT